MSLWGNKDAKGLTGLITATNGSKQYLLKNIKAK